METLNSNSLHDVDLKAMARKVMMARGFEPNFPPQVNAQIEELKVHSPNVTPGSDVRDLRHLFWSSIDNDTSRDLDQIEVAERLPNGDVKVMIAIADVDAFVVKNSPIDAYAFEETATIYTGVQIFPMLPEELSYHKTSLLEDADNLAIVMEFTVQADGSLVSSDVYRAVVRNRAQLTYNSVGQWLEGKAPAPKKVADSVDLQMQLKLQDEVAQILKTRRYEHGALYVESIELQPVLKDEQMVDVVNQEKNRATELIEDLMITANGVVARFLGKVSSLRRIVKTPKRWDRIVEIAAVHGKVLPAEPSSKALNVFLISQKTADPDHFADLSLAVIKLIGKGEYVLELPGAKEQGHFGLAVQNYTHSTAPNRRFADLVTHRLIKAVLAGKSNPYTDAELTTIAQNCTLKETAANKVERDMTKRIAAVVMRHRIGEIFEALVTGVTSDGTFVRVLHPHVEGLLTHQSANLDVGDKLRVKLISTDVERGYIDFAEMS